MILIKKANVKEHFAAKRRLRLVATGPASEPDATGPSEAEPAGTGAHARAFTEDFLVEHASSNAPVTPIAIVADTGPNQARKVSGSRKA